MKYLITGRLTQESPMRAVFPDGQIPLARPGTSLALLGNPREEVKEWCYFLALPLCTDEQLERAAEMMAGMGQGTKEEALVFLREQSELPIRSLNIAGVSMPLRAFI